MQRERRRDPYPWTWEIPVAAVPGDPIRHRHRHPARPLHREPARRRGLDLARRQRRRRSPHRSGPRSGPAFPDVLGGHADAGLPTPTPAALAGRGLVWVSLAMTEVAAADRHHLGRRLGLPALGPGTHARHGTAAEAEKILGVTGCARSPASSAPTSTASTPPPRRTPVQRTAGDLTEQPGPQLGHGLSPWLLNGRRTKSRGAMKLRFNPWDVGWRIGDAHEPRGGELWVPWDRTAGVIGPQGSGKTLDLLTPALLSAPGAALVTLTKVEDLLAEPHRTFPRGPAVRGPGPVRAGRRVVAGVGGPTS